MGKLTHTVSGGVASFRSADKANIESLKVYFNPIQAGTGTPSPSNVRSISGWNGLNIYRNGKNLVDVAAGVAGKAVRAGNVTASNPLGSETISVTFSGTGYIPIKPNTYYTISITNYATVGGAGHVLYEDKSVESAISGVPLNMYSNSSPSTYTFLTPSNARYIRASWYNEADNDVQLEEGSTLTSYASFVSQTYPVSWQSEAGTLYGGYVDLVSGELVATYATYTVDNNTAFYNSTNRPTSWLRIDLDGSAGSKKMKPFTQKYDRGERCDKFDTKFTSSSNSTYAWFGSYENNTFYNSIYIMNLNLTNPSLSNGAECIEYVRSLAPTFVYPIANPITYQLTPMQMKTLLDHNNIWSDANGDVECTYEVHDRLAKSAFYFNSELFLPPGYQKVDYLRTYGHDARIDTGVQGDDHTLQFDTEFMFTTINNSYIGIFGNYKDENTSKVWRCILPNINTYPDPAFLYVTPGNGTPGGTYSSTTVSYPYGSGSSILNKKITVHMEYGLCLTTGSTTVRNTPSEKTGAAENNRNIAIGASYTTSTGGTTTARIYFFKIHSHGKLIRNYVPCYRKSDNKAGFYDTVNHTFNPSIGSAEFVAGND